MARNVNTHLASKMYVPVANKHGVLWTRTKFALKFLISSVSKLERHCQKSPNFGVPAYIRLRFLSV